MREYFFLRKGGKNEKSILIKKSGRWKMDSDKFYTCKSDRAFKEVFLKKNDSEPLQALLELILEIKIDYLEIKKT